MPIPKLGPAPNVKLTLGTSGGRCSVESDLVVYTFGTFFLVLILYIATRGWKGYTAPEELDLGSVQVPCDRSPTFIRTSAYR